MAAAWASGDRPVRGRVARRQARQGLAEFRRAPGAALDHGRDARRQQAEEGNAQDGEGRLECAPAGGIGAPLTENRGRQVADRSGLDVQVRTQVEGARGQQGTEIRVGRDDHVGHGDGDVVDVQGCIRPAGGGREPFRQVDAADRLKRDATDRDRTLGGLPQRLPEGQFEVSQVGRRLDGGLHQADGQVRRYRHLPQAGPERTRGAPRQSGAGRRGGSGETDAVQRGAARQPVRHGRCFARAPGSPCRGTAGPRHAGVRSRGRTAAPARPRCRLRPRRGAGVSHGRSARGSWRRWRAHGRSARQRRM